MNVCAHYKENTLEMLVNNLKNTSGNVPCGCKTLTLLSNTPHNLP